MIIDNKHLGCFGCLPKRCGKPTAIVIHHTCTKSPKKTRETLSKKGCSTHFEVDKDGTIYQYANINEVCSHCGAPNVHSIGIDVTHIKDAPWPEDQVTSVKELVSFLCNQTGIPQKVHMELSGIYPHKAIGNTVCPQDFPMEKLNAE